MRRFSLLRIGLSVVITLIGPVVSGFGQEVSPLVVVSQESKPLSSGAGLSVRLRNDSSMNIVAYSVGLEFFTASGKPLHRLYCTAVMGLSPGSQPLKPGESTSAEFQVPEGQGRENPQPQVWVNYVLFESQSKSWGPDRDRVSQTIRGMIDGTRLERGRLRHLLSQKGVQAVIDDLNASN